MYTVMLADDNKFALSHFTNLVNWEELGFSLAATAVDGIEAWEKFCTCEPDLVITDIQMPGINGIQLAEKIRERSPDTVVVFLSSYDEFDYARSAISLNVWGYILKHELNKAFLEEKLCEIAKYMQGEKEKAERVLAGQIFTLFQTPLEDLDKSYFPALTNETYDFLILEQDHIPHFLAKKSSLDTEEGDYRTWIPKIKEKYGEIRCLLRFRRFRWICLLEYREHPEELGRRMQKALYEEYGVSFSVYIMARGCSPWQCRVAYESRKYIFDQRYFEGMRAVMFLDMYEKPEPFPVPDLGSSFLSEDLDKIFLPVLYSYDFEAFEKCCLGILDHLEKIFPKEMQEELYNEEVLYLFTAKRVIRWIKGKCQDGTVYNRQRKVSDYHILKTAEDFMGKTYGNSLLSVEDIAQEAGVSVNWLNDLFKKEHNETVGRFLTRIRMEKAKELLESGEHRISEIAGKTGYNSPSYLAKVFKKTYGLSPQEYYERNMGRKGK